MPTACPICLYERLPSDDAPEWQCPKCGKAYAKAASPTTPKKKSQRKRPPAKRKMGLGRVMVITLLVAILVIILTVGWNAKHYYDATMVQKQAVSLCKESVWLNATAGAFSSSYVTKLQEKRLTEIYIEVLGVIHPAVAYRDARKKRLKEAGKNTSHEDNGQYFIYHCTIDATGQYLVSKDELVVITGANGESFLAYLGEDWRQKYDAYNAVLGREIFPYNLIKSYEKYKIEESPGFDISNQ